MTVLDQLECMYFFWKTHMNPDFSGTFGSKTSGKSTLLTFCFHSPIATRESVNKIFLRYLRGVVQTLCYLFMKITIFNTQESEVQTNSLCILEIK